LNVELVAVVTTDEEFLSENEAELSSGDVKTTCRGSEGGVTLGDTNVPLEKCHRRKSKDQIGMRRKRKKEKIRKGRRGFRIWCRRGKESNKSYIDQIIPQIIGGVP